MKLNNYYNIFIKVNVLRSVLYNTMNLNQKNILSSIFRKHLLLFVFLSFAVALPSAFATDPVPGWDFSTYTTNDGGVASSGISTMQIALTGVAAPGQGTLTARITSDSDPDGFDLILNEQPMSDGEYKSTQLALMTTESVVTMDDSVTVRVLFVSTPGPESLGIITDTANNADLGTSDDDPLYPVLTLTSEPDIYEATFSFGPSTDPSSSIVAGKPGDIFTVFRSDPALYSHGFIGPNPDVGKGAILVDIGDKVYANIDGDPTYQFEVVSAPGGGIVGGGPTPQIIVVDSHVGSSGSTCSGDCTPPTLGIGATLERIVYNGFSYNQNPVDVEQYYTPYPLITTIVGKENVVELKIFDDGGPQNIEHVGLAFGLGHGESFGESKATINLDRDRNGKEFVTLFDPENVFDNVHVLTKIDYCDGVSGAQCLMVSIYHTFREPLNFNMVATYVWDFYKNGWQNYYNHGIHIDGDSLNPPKTKKIAFGEKNMKGKFLLTQIDKKNDLWADEFGNIYQNKGNDRFDRIYDFPKEIVYDKVGPHGCTRTCNWFEYEVLHQELLAEIKLNEILRGQEIKSVLEEPFSYVFHIIQRHEDPQLQANIQDEIKKAEKLYTLLYGDHK